MQNIPNASAVPRPENASPSESFLSARARALKVAPTIAISEQAKSMQSAGIDVVNLAVGEPDFATPDRIIAAAHMAMLNGQTRYTAPDGNVQVKKAVQAKLLRDNGLDYALDEVGVVSGCKQVLFNAMAATVEAGDEVIIVTPYWVSYADMVTYHGGIVRLVVTGPETQFQPDIDDLTAAISLRTKWILINSPNNPTGAVYSAQFYRDLGAVMRAHPQVMLLSDEIYEHLTFGNLRHESPAAVLPDLKDRILTVNGVSKAYAMTGWRIGFAAGPQWLIGAMAKVQSQSAGSTNTPAQWAAAEAMEGDQSELGSNCARFEKRRDMALEILQSCPLLQVTRPGGAFYLFVDVGRLIGMHRPDGGELTNDHDVTAYLLDTAHVATVPGAEFGCSAFVRLSFAVDEAALQKACHAIVSACNALTERGTPA